MIVNVKFFASLRERLDVDELEIELSNGSTLNDLIQELDSLIDAPIAEIFGEEDLRVAVNLEMIEGNVSLQQDDEVAFYPPITGG